MAPGRGIGSAELRALEGSQPAPIDRDGVVSHGRSETLKPDQNASATRLVAIPKTPHEKPIELVSDGSSEFVDPKTGRRLRVAILHYWLVSMGGGEKVIEALLEIFPDAEIFTILQKPEIAQRVVGNAKVHSSFLQKIPFATRFHRKLLPLMPLALENLDLTGFDLIISSESGPAKGVLPPLGALHICYCHSPMRYVWDQFQDYRRESGTLARAMMSFFIPQLRVWDFISSTRVDYFISNSRHVRSRIRQYYRRDAKVIHPPVDTTMLRPATVTGDFYLITGRHVAYKRIDLAIEACNRTNRRLVITGDGPETSKLKKMAGPTIEFVGRCPLDRLRGYYAECLAFLMPGEEDFGIAPVEAMASGRPVIAYGCGGALDTVIEGVSGVLFAESSTESLIDALDRFEASGESFDPAVIVEHASQFSREAFLVNFRGFVRDAIELHASRDDFAPVDSRLPACD